MKSLKIEKNIKNILLSFYLENELENPFTYQQANINLKTTFQLSCSGVTFSFLVLSASIPLMQA